MTNMSSFWWTSADQVPSQATKKNGQHMKKNLCWDFRGRAVPRPQERKAKRVAARRLPPPRAPPTLTGRTLRGWASPQQEGDRGDKTAGQDPPKRRDSSKSAPWGRANRKYTRPHKPKRSVPWLGSWRTRESALLKRRQKTARTATAASRYRYGSSKIMTGI